MKLKLILTLLLSVIFTAPLNAEEEEIELKTIKDKISYVAGTQYGNSGYVGLIPGLLRLCVPFGSGVGHVSAIAPSSHRGNSNVKAATLQYILCTPPPSSAACQIVPSVSNRR